MLGVLAPLAQRLGAGGAVFIGQTTGTNNYTAQSPEIVEYEEGQELIILFGNTNTQAATININGLGVRDITTADNSALLPGAIIGGGVRHMVLVGNTFRLLAETGPRIRQIAQGIFQGNLPVITFAIPTLVNTNNTLAWVVGESSGPTPTGVAFNPVVLDGLTNTTMTARSTSGSVDSIFGNWYLIEFW
ncbi:MAG: hypothetical protein FWB71_04730 [Defluviitaleaceae bacterium]|nr:hypothetical protein [Defluviitaleaceae bacterium]